MRLRLSRLLNNRRKLLSWCCRMIISTIFLSTPPPSARPRTEYCGSWRQRWADISGRCSRSSPVNPSTTRGASSLSDNKNRGQALANELCLPVKTPVGTVTVFETMKDRYWILKEPANMRKPEEHLHPLVLPRWLNGQGKKHHLRGIPLIV